MRLQTRASFLAGILLCVPAVVLSQGVSPSAPDDELSLLLERVQSYVIDYESRLGTLIGEEVYAQEAEWRRPSAVGGFPRVDRATRRMASDFLLLEVGREWFGVRNVLTVDGNAVEPVEEFASLVMESPETIVPAWPDNVRYNLGDFERTFNVPTFSLRVLRPELVGRFQFEIRNRGREAGRDVWEIGFVEVESPTLVQGREGDDRFATGRFWVYPGSGEILRTELAFEMEAGGERLGARVRVSYGQNALLGMRVPSRMEETYSSAAHTVETRADYRDFMRFGVDVSVGAEATVP